MTTFDNSRQLSASEIDRVSGAGHPISNAPEPTLSQDVTNLSGVGSTLAGVPGNVGTAKGGLLGLGG